MLSNKHVDSPYESMSTAHQILLKICDHDQLMLCGVVLLVGVWVVDIGLLAI